jgi:hypothetical protein
MTLAYIVTEANKDIDILEKLLPKNLSKDVKFVDGKGEYGAFSLASSLLATRPIPVVLVTDADKDDDSSVNEQLNSLNYLLRQASHGLPFKVCIVNPEIEIILLQNRLLIEKLAKRSFTDLEWLFAQSKPKEFFHAVFGKDTLIHEKIFSNISEEEIKVLQQHPLIQDLINFLSSLTATV